MDRHKAMSSRNSSDESARPNQLLWIDVSEAGDVERQAKSKRVHIANVQRRRKEKLERDAPECTDRGTQTPNWAPIRHDNPAGILFYQQSQSWRSVTAEPGREPSQLPQLYSSDADPVDYAARATTQSSIPADYYSPITVPRFSSGYHDLGLYLAEAGHHPEFARYFDANPTVLHGYAFHCTSNLGLSTQILG